MAITHVALDKCEISGLGSRDNCRHNLLLCPLPRIHGVKAPFWLQANMFVFSCAIQALIQCRVIACRDVKKIGGSPAMWNKSRSRRHFQDATRHPCCLSRSFSLDQILSGKKRIRILRSAFTNSSNNWVLASHRHTLYVRNFHKNCVSNTNFCQIKSVFFFRRSQILVLSWLFFILLLHYFSV